MGTPAARPKVVLWYKAYCGLLTLTYLAMTGLGVVLVFARNSLADAQNPPESLLVAGLICAVLGLAFAAPCGAALLLPPVPWTWIYHMVIICIGLTSMCCIPICVPLLIFWIKPETKAYFGRTA
jgi:hypothetical protein